MGNIKKAMLGLLKFGGNSMGNSIWKTTVQVQETVGYSSRGTILISD